LIAAEEVVELRATLWKRRKNWASDDLADGKRMSVIFLVVLLYYLYNAYSRTGDVMSALRLPTVGIAGILLLIFGLAPLYEGWKTLRKGSPKSEDEWASEIAESRFDSWLYRQKAPLTYCLLALMLVVGVTQLVIEELNMEWSAKSIVRGGLLKQSVNGLGGEWWRFLTAPCLHGNLLHWIMNAAALRFLARRVENLARWPHVLIVLAGAALAGGVCTYYFTSAPSVGASGGIMGLLGFLLVFEVLHIKVYAAVVFPSSKSPRRPRIMQQDRLIAIVSGVVILGGVALTVMKLVG